jgi:DNA primase
MTEQKEQANFALIRANVTMQMLLDHYRLGLKKQGQELRGKCPLPGCGAGQRSFQVNSTKNVFHCFSCRAGGNVIDFVAKMESCNIREAGLKIQNWFNLVGETGIPPAPEQPEEPRGDDQPTDQAAEILTTLKEVLAELRQLRLKIGDRKVCPAPQNRL